MYPIKTNWNTEQRIKNVSEKKNNNKRKKKENGGDPGSKRIMDRMKI